MSEKREGDWIKVFSGGMFWPLDPRAEEVNITDIAHSLSLLCRYGGHSNCFYSVAEHSVHMADLLDRQTYSDDIIKWALLHDASEAYCADVPRPLKKNLPDYMALEDRISKVIIQHFGLLPEMPLIVKEYDDRICLNEMDELLNNHLHPVREGLRLPDIEIRGWYPEKAKTEFLKAYNKYFWKIRI